MKETVKDYTTLKHRDVSYYFHKPNRIGRSNHLQDICLYKSCGENIPDARYEPAAMVDKSPIWSRHLFVFGAGPCLICYITGTIFNVLAS